MPDAVPLVVEKADEADDEEERQADSQTGESNNVKIVEIFLQGLCRDVSIKISKKENKRILKLPLKSHYCTVMVWVFILVCFLFYFEIPPAFG